MLYVDFPDAQAEPESIIVQVTDRQGATGTISVGWCQLSPTAEQLQARPVGARFTPLLPRLIAESFFDDPVAANRLGLERSRVEIIEAPRHGRIGQELSVDSRIGYVPESGFVGNDRAVFLLTASDGTKIRLAYFIQVDAKFDAATNPSFDYRKSCPRDNPRRLPLSGAPEIKPRIIKRIEAENQDSPNRLGMPGGALYPASAVMSRLKYKSGVEPVGAVATTVVKRPAHGRVTSDGVVVHHPTFPKAAYDTLTYQPDRGFYGTDSVEFQVTVNGKDFRVSFKVNVVDRWENGETCNRQESSSDPLNDTVAVSQEPLAASEFIPTTT